MSDLEKLSNVIQQLNNICVPTILLEQVTLPIRNSAIILESIYKNMKKEQDELQAAPEISVEPITEELNG